MATVTLMIVFFLYADCRRNIKYGLTQVAQFMFVARNITLVCCWTWWWIGHDGSGCFFLQCFATVVRL